MAYPGMFDLAGKVKTAADLRVFSSASETLELMFGQESGKLIGGRMAR